MGILLLSSLSTLALILAVCLAVCLNRHCMRHVAPKAAADALDLVLRSTELRQTLAFDAVLRSPELRALVQANSAAAPRAAAFPRAPYRALAAPTTRPAPLVVRSPSSLQSPSNASSRSTLSWGEQHSEPYSHAAAAHAASGATAAEAVGTEAVGTDAVGADAATATAATAATALHSHRSVHPDHVHSHRSVHPDHVACLRRLKDDERVRSEASGFRSGIRSPRQALLGAMELRQALHACRAAQACNAAATAEGAAAVAAAAAAAERYYSKRAVPSSQKPIPSEPRSPPPRRSPPCRTPSQRSPPTPPSRAPSRALVKWTPSAPLAASPAVAPPNERAQGIKLIESRSFVMGHDRAADAVSPYPRTAALALAMADADDLDDELAAAQRGATRANRGGEGHARASGESGNFVFARSAAELDERQDEVRRRAAERAHRISDRYADDPPDERRPPSKRLTKLTRRPADRDDADALLSDRLSRLLLRVERQAERRFERKLGKLQA